MWMVSISAFVKLSISGVSRILEMIEMIRLKEIKLMADALKICI